MVFEQIEKLKQQYTDKYVVVDENRPELRRFKGQTGLVKTVNMNGRALVQFNVESRWSWHDIELDFLKVVDRPVSSEPVHKVQRTGKKVPGAAAPAGSPDLPAADVLSAARSAKPAAAAKAASGGDTQGTSVAEILAAARAAKAAGAGSATSPKMPTSPATPASAKTPEAKAAKVTPAKAVPASPAGKETSVADILAAARAAKAAGGGAAAPPPMPASPTSTASTASPDAPQAKMTQAKAVPAAQPGQGDVRGGHSGRGPRGKGRRRGSPALSTSLAHSHGVNGVPRGSAGHGDTDQGGAHITAWEADVRGGHSGRGPRGKGRRRRRGSPAPSAGLAHSHGVNSATRGSAN